MKGRVSSLLKAKKKIEKFFGTGDTWSFSEQVLFKLFYAQRDEWGIVVSSTAKSFIRFLKIENLISVRNFSTTKGEKAIYTWKTSDDLTIYSGLKSGSYFTHYSAMSIHGLTLQIPKTYYLNYEHSDSSSQNNVLKQKDIDDAFSKPQRKTTSFCSYRGKRIYLLNGKYTNRLGVVQMQNENQRFYYTDLERTLIDIAIRPSYSGGIFEVLDAYKAAKGKVDCSVMETYLTKLDFTYPYHQVIGFYLQLAEFERKELEKFQKNFEFDFYLVHNMRRKKYSKRWRLYYPDAIADQKSD